MTKDDFYHAAIVSGLVSEDAVHDAENYDGGEVLEQLDAMYAALQVEPTSDPWASARCAECNAPLEPGKYCSVTCATNALNRHVQPPNRQPEPRCECRTTNGIHVFGCPALDGRKV